MKKVISSLCPICLKVVTASIYQDGDRILMEKMCEDHGYFNDIYWSDAELYEKFMKYMCDGQPLSNSKLAKDGCPCDCGLCSNHLTGTLLGNIDLTNRCNMACPVCFADAGGSSYEPTLEQLKFMMQNLRAERPVPCPAVQFTGGEPTMRDDLPQIVAMAKGMGFSQIQIATNGLKLASSFELCKALEKSGLNTVYLQFDGVTSEPYKIVRGRDILPIKLKAMDNMRKAGQTSVVLVPTMAKGVNDHQAGEIVRFASQNLDIIKGINFQPVSFAGRIEAEERIERRITIPDLLRLLEDQTDNEICREDFYPIPFIVPMSHLVSAGRGTPQPTFSVHPCCGAATYVYKFKDKLVPITRFIDVEGLMETVRIEAEGFNGSNLSKIKMTGMIIKELPKFVDDSSAPKDLNVTKTLLKLLKNGTRESLKEFHNKTLFLGAMHFQDGYNIDLERLQRCGVHYATPDGRIIPFCSYNTIHRNAVEARFSTQKKTS